ncbi:MAG: hypothetical protein SCM96_06460 [Acidobacteriota bacterium]|nr:hypothetical protein [Acidobacteriota bacterium]
MAERDSREILRTWKEISVHMNVNLRTCFRWEKEFGLPIHRINRNSRRSSVFAYKSELDRWLADKPLSVPAQNPEVPMFRRHPLRILAAGAAVSFVAVASFLFVSPHSGRTVEPKELTIALAPIEILDDHARNAYLSEGFTNEIINYLTFYEGIRIIPAMEAIPETSGQDIPFGPQPDFTLRGALRRDSGSLFLNVSLDRRYDGARVLDLGISKSSDNPLAAVDNLCGKIGEALGLPETTGRNARPLRRIGNPKSRNNESYEAYLKGTHILGQLSAADGGAETSWRLYDKGTYYVRQSSREANETAIRFFNKALELDGSFAHAHIGLAAGFLNYVNFGWDSRMKWLEKAEELLMTAQSLSPNLPDYFSTLIKTYLLMDVCFNSETRNKAYELAEEGLKHYPNHPRLESIVGYCYYLKFGEHGNEEDFVKALEYKEKSYWMNPFSFDNLVYTELLMLNGEFRKAADICNLLRQRDSSDMALFRFGEILYYQDDLETARTVMEQFEDPLDYRIPSLLYLGQIAGRLGDEDAVETLSSRIEQISPGDYKFSADLLRLASMHLGVGNKEKGLRYLERFFSGDLARRIPYIYGKHIALDGNFDAWREDADFLRILRKGMTSWRKAKSSGLLLTSKNAFQN